jgi:hypothetical protein
MMKADQVVEKEVATANRVFSKPPPKIPAIDCQSMVSSFNV